MQETADAVAADLGEIDPQHGGAYRANADAFKAALQRLIDRERQLMRQVKGTGVAVTEPVPDYMLDALGLDNETPPAFGEAVEAGDDVAVSVLAHTLDLFTSHAVAALVYNAQTTGAVTDQVKQAAQDAGVPVVSVTELVPSGQTYVEWMTGNLERIAAAVA
jgi:zinc/manganese transport system substrate-binding protein